jgi:hypothetical protein
MSITPQGRSIQSMYGDFRDGKLIVNRRYQRKLVWSLEEKRKLIDSILQDYPVPLILLAELRSGTHAGKFEIIDGMQRLNAIFTFIEHGFDLSGKRFDLKQFSRARQAAEEGIFTPILDAEVLSPRECSRVLDYQLAITSYPANSEIEITEVFGRINAHGRQLSPQEQRQAGVANCVSAHVRQLASEIRGDVSKEVLDLADMPEISVEHEQSPHGYGIKAEDTIWCKQGILTRRQLRDSDDEQIILDLLASVVLGEPIAASRETFDKFYDRDMAESIKLETALLAYGEDRIKTELLGTFSVLTDMISQVSTENYFLRSKIRPGGNNPIKGPFYALFMAVFDLVVKQQKSPDRIPEIFDALINTGESLTSAAHYATMEDRTRNINTIKGLIQDYFVDRLPPVFTSGAGLALQVENCLRRSQIETSRYETKQGFLNLSGGREWNRELEERILETVCAIANLGDDGDIFIGVADDLQDANRVQVLDGVTPITIGRRYVVGVEREAAFLGIDVEAYMRRIIDILRNSKLSEPLKTQVLSAVDAVEFKGLTIIRIAIPRQSAVSFLNERCFIREGSETKEVTGPGILSIQKIF